MPALTQLRWARILSYGIRVSEADGLEGDGITGSYLEH